MPNDTQNWHMLRLLDRFRERYPKRFEEPAVSKKRAGSVAMTGGIPTLYK